jgi:hypothetical protein
MGFKRDLREFSEIDWGFSWISWNSMVILRD